MEATYSELWLSNFFSNKFTMQGRSRADEF